MNPSPILVIGKNGKTGRRVSQRLQALGHAVRGVSRSTTPEFDWDRPETWRSAIEGARAAYVSYQPDLALPRAATDIATFVEIARDVGVQHIVLLSGRGEAGAQRAEKIVNASGIPWNLVRANWFFQNFSESFMIEGILAGELALPAGDTPEPFVDADDIAEVAVAALTEPELRNRVFEVSGPRAMTFADCLRELSQALGRPVNYTQVPVDDYIDALDKQGVPEAVQWLLRELFTQVLDGRNSQVTQGVEEALGRPASDFQTYLRKTMDAGVWLPDRMTPTAGS